MMTWHKTSESKARASRHDRAPEPVAEEEEVVDLEPEPVEDLAPPTLTQKLAAIAAPPPPIEEEEIDLEPFEAEAPPVKPEPLDRSCARQTPTVRQSHRRRRSKRKMSS